jgi:DNA-damage-inducible protein J
MSTTTINARIDLDCKKEAQGVLEKLGLSMSGAIEMFFKQIVLQQGLPFDVKLPNQDTARAMEELEANAGAKFSSVEELFEDLDN